ncbi:hypothetical protein [Ralstonia psammae]|uniref:hypothetical protein n=1 Tax=Ralstonia psammae TaxID=3058598 RepID=UPI003D185B26
MKIAQEHRAYSIFPPAKRDAITPKTRVVEDLNLQGELAEDFLEDVVQAFLDFELSEGRGDFNFDRYFASEISRRSMRGLLYLLYPKAKKSDQEKKAVLTPGMLQDAISRGYWDSARYANWNDGD